MNCAAGVNCVVGRVYTGSRDGSGLLVAWVVGFMGIFRLYGKSLEFII